MNDLEITKLCAEAMDYSYSGIAPTPEDGAVIILVDIDSDTVGARGVYYAPLHDDAQAMSLVKKLGLGIYRETDGWGCFKFRKSGPDPDVFSDNLNQAICKCAAQMQMAKAAA